jgi:CTP:molybdopterin cytidylyltransferase MocA
MITGVLLAAGASRRMGRDKALVRTHGQSFAAHGLHGLWRVCDAVVIVLGSNAPRVRAAIEVEFERLARRGVLRKDLKQARRHGARRLEARFVVNRGWKQGMLCSARLGLKAALTFVPESVLLLPVDHPGIRADTVETLAGTMREALGAFGGRRRQKDAFAYALVPRYQRRRGHPIALSPALARAVIADRRALDLSDAVRRNARLVGYLDCADSGVLRNRNTPTRAARR